MTSGNRKFDRKQGDVTKPVPKPRLHVVARRIEIATGMTFTWFSDNTVTKHKPGHTSEYEAVKGMVDYNDTKRFTSL